ncbi:MAG: alpha/beta hydrolase [Beijerinckiaceae bacterium]|nr:alpha/beta hydrolase [Beijerinckiaceae bacterium]
MQTFLCNGVNIAFWDYAPTGPDINRPILLIHGFGSNHAVNWLNTLWIKTLTHAGRRVIAFDNRGHGKSGKPYEPELYSAHIMAEDADALLDHLGIKCADVMGYSMGARITAYLALAHPERVRSAILGGLGHHLVAGVGLPIGIADAMEAPALESLTDPMQRMFRAFADQTKSDLRALAACIRGSRQTLSEIEVSAIRAPVLVAVGTKDAVAGDAHKLAAMIPGAQVLDIPGRDHNLAVGDKVFKEGVLKFLSGLG